MKCGLWFFQILLAVVFLGAGCAKIVLPIDALGATMFTPPDQPQFALVPIAVGLLAASVAYARWRMAPPFLPSRRGLRGGCALQFKSASRDAPASRAGSTRTS